MHSKDPGKQSGPLFDAFWLEFERILEEAEEGEANFSCFVFPKLDFRERKFQVICRFRFAIFSQNADFSDTTFTQKAIFNDATFIKGASFCSANFMEDALFSFTTFKQNANFRYATFKQNADFSQSNFKQNADFNNAIFAGETKFIESTFTQDADFGSATFEQLALFTAATFAQNSYFGGATFTCLTDFAKVRFSRDVGFNSATFTQKVFFSMTEFQGTVTFLRARFLDQAEFLQTRFSPQIAGESSAVFALASFSKPSEIFFDDVDLSRALFHNCDVSQVWFTSTVQWGKRDGNRGLAVFDETIPLEQETAKELQRGGERNYGAVAQVYRQLKKNYDSRLDYWTANEFHFGEMEMKRLVMPKNGRLLWLRWWLHRNVSLVALYRWASDYGNSYRKPVVWLLGVLLLSTALFPLPISGLMQQGATQAETYVLRWNYQKNFGENLRTERALVINSVVASVDAAIFQKNPEYSPAYPWGRVVAIVETLLTSSLFALFLLAIRRQFRR
jgi:hypothetical protein